ncbi:MAG: polyprenyl diphosphate synthase [Verrucomicrobiota bacterium JB022]|nr:polyprenyl diphosphate synthase [Verrucomicrobiota bacterium JB022]
MSDSSSTALLPPPQHIAIIMDGNGRWAQRQGLPRNEGHRRGVDNVKRIVQAARDQQIRHLTLYAFSVENWKRPKLEVEALMRLLESFLKDQQKVLHENHIRLGVLGRWHELPKRVVKLLEQTIAETAQYTEWNLNLALNYGSRTEVVDAFQAYGRAVLAGKEKPDAADWETVARHLYTGALPDPDLVIRTSGECRISNFLLLQCAYAEYYFTPVCWPEFDEACFADAVNSYRRRERRYGLTGEQVRVTEEPTASV